MIFLFIVGGCTTSKNVLQQKKDQASPIEIAIADYSLGNKGITKDSVFEVMIFDSLYRMYRIPGDELSYKRNKGKRYDGIIGISIMSPSCLTIFVPHAIHQKKGGDWHLSCKEQDGKLFYWRDYHHNTTNESRELLKKYNLLHYSKNGDSSIAINGYFEPERKATHYYFCRNKLSKYRKVVTDEEMGDYDPPALNCGKR